VKRNRQPVEYLCGKIDWIYWNSQYWGCY